MRPVENGECGAEGDSGGGLGVVEDGFNPVEGFAIEHEEAVAKVFDIRLFE